MADSPEDLVQVALEGHVAVVAMNEPQRRNVFSTRMRQRLLAAFEALCDQDGDTRAIVLTGQGGHFCGGGDLSEMTTAPPPIALRERVAVATRLVRHLHAGPRPVVAAVEGHCVGAGVALAAACDFVVASREARFSMGFARVGLLPDTGILWTLPQKVGMAKARELLLSAATISAEEAHRLGLVSTLVEPGQALAVAQGEAARLAQLPPVTMMLLKGALLEGMNSLQQAVRAETDLNPLVRMTTDHQEAVQAFLDKRRPVFTGQ